MSNCYLNEINCVNQNGSIWDFKGKLDFVDEWFMMSSPVAMIAITVSYLLFVRKLGPEYMKHRQPYKLKNVLVLYNLVQVFVSAYLFYLSSRLMLPNGFVSKTCLLEKEETRLTLATIMYYYHLAKLSEVLDTVFFVLRKKDNQITFLHVYHHAMMVVTSWSILKYEPTYPTIFIRNINSFVHVVMYAYYGLSSFPSLTKYLWWKKYITSMQLIQFTLILIHFVMTYTTSECTPSYPLCLTIIINTSLFIVLFGKFYLENYTKRSKRKAKEDLPNVKVNGDGKITNKNNGYFNGDTNSITKEISFVNRKK